MESIISQRQKACRSDGRISSPNIEVNTTLEAPLTKSKCFPEHAEGLQAVLSMLGLVGELLKLCIHRSGSERLLIHVTCVGDGSDEHYGFLKAQNRHGGHHNVFLGHKNVICSAGKAVESSRRLRAGVKPRSGKRGGPRAASGQSFKFFSLLSRRHPSPPPTTTVSYISHNVEEVSLDPTEAN
jgi:hypothetical protein